MRHAIIPLAALVIALPIALRQQLDIIPTHEADMATAAQGLTPQRGGATGSCTRAGTDYYISQSTGYGAGPAPTNTPIIGVPVSATDGVRGETLPKTGPAGARVSAPLSTVFGVSEDSFNLGWTASNVTVTAASATGFDGTTSASKLADTSAVAVGTLTKSAITISNNSERFVFTLWASCDVTHQFQISLQLTGGATPVTGTSTFTCTAAEGPRKFTVTAQNNGSGNTSMAGVVTPASASAAGTDYIYASRWEFYQTTVSGVSGAVTYNFDAINGVSTPTRAVETLAFSGVPSSDTETMCEWVWYQSSGTTVLGDWFQTGGGDTNSYMEFAINASNQLRFLTAPGGTIAGTLSSSTTVSQRAWHYVCAEWDQPSSTIKMFLDGAEVSYNAGTTAWTGGINYGTTLTMGGTGRNAGDANSGEAFIADQRVYNKRLLTAAKIKNLYTKQKAIRGY